MASGWRAGSFLPLRRGLIQLAWRFLVFQKDSALARWYRTRTEGPRGPDHEAVIRFCGQGSEAAGPFSQRHCSERSLTRHSRSRVTPQRLPNG
jgi:hypothetical protein